MFKETVICIVIIILIVCLDLFTQNFTKQSVELITKELSSIKEEITLGDRKIIKEKIDELDKSWKDMHNKLAYYIEHDELEKVDTAIVNMKSYFETEDFSSATAELEEGKFVLEHIQDKNSFNLQNIF